MVIGRQIEMSRNFGKVQEPPPEERKLFGLVLMLREWVERSFCAEQEERLNAKGRLCARFQVDLGEEMTKQLQNYVAASPPLRLIKIRVVKREGPSKHPQECAEVVMSPEARAVYAEKCPGAVAKYRARKRKASSELDATQSKRKSDKVVPAVNLADMNADSKPAKAVAEVSGTGSVWEQCEAHIVPAGIDGLVEAKNALDEGLARIEAGGLVALKAEKELVAWLKGLSVCKVGATGLRATKIGLSVNACRKHPEPYISGLAASLLKPWKRVWRESEESHRQCN